MKRVLVFISVLINLVIAQNDLTLDLSKDINVTDYDVTGDGLTNDHTKMQLIFDTIRDEIVKDNSKSATVYFPKGTYLIDKSLKIPPKCNLIGAEGGYSFENLYTNPNLVYKNHTLPVIKMKASSPYTMLESYELQTGLITFVEYQAAIIKNLVFDGNNSATCGIQVLASDPQISNIDRPNTLFDNILVYHVNGDGFYAGEYSGELEFQRVMMVENSGYGFRLLKTTDIEFSTNSIVNKNGAGGNNKSGLYLSEYSGKFNMTNFDSWGNSDHGILLDKVVDINLTKLMIDVNYKCGIKIISCNNIVVQQATFKDNSREDYNGLYSHVELEDNGTTGDGSSNIKFIDCNFGNTDAGAAGKLSKYAIEEKSIKPKYNNEIKKYPNTLSLKIWLYLKELV